MGRINDLDALPKMLTSRRIIQIARVLFVFAATGMAVLMLGPFQGLERSFGLNDKAAHAIAFYAVAVGLFLIAPRRRRSDLALFVVAAALGAECLQYFTGRRVSVGDFLAGAGGVVAAWLPGRVEQLRHAARGYPNLTPTQIRTLDRRRRVRPAQQPAPDLAAGK